MKPLFSKKNVAYAAYLLVVIFIALEIILRIYNPFPFRVKGNKIILPVNKQYFIDNERIPVLERHIVNTKNSLGFRGAEMPADIGTRLSILTVGGSTTECQFLSDGKTWSDHLNEQLNHSFKNIWLNNAGLAGHSTFGNLILLQDYLVKLHPKVIIFSVGCNDISRDDLNESDKSNMTGHYKTIFTFFTKNSEVCSLVENLIRTRRARTKNMTDVYIDLAKRKWDTLSLSRNFMDAKLQEQQKYLRGFQSRIEEMIIICRKNNITPVFVTQPSLFGEGKDDLTGVNLETFKLENELNGKLWWQTLELFNDMTKQVAERNNIFVIDLAKEMPKSSRYFYDLVHFTNDGSEEVSEIIGKELKGYLSEQFPRYKK